MDRRYVRGYARCRGIIIESSLIRDYTVHLALVSVAMRDINRHHLRTASLNLAGHCAINELFQYILSGYLFGVMLAAKRRSEWARYLHQYVRYLISGHMVMSDPQNIIVTIIIAPILPKSFP